MIVPRAFQHRHGATSPSSERSKFTERSQEKRTEKTPAPLRAWRPEPVSRAAPSQPILIRTRPSTHKRCARSSRDTLRPPPTSQPSSGSDHATVSRARKPSAGNVFTTDEDVEEVETYSPSLGNKRGIRRHNPAQPLSSSSPRSWELLQTPFDTAGLEDDGASFDSDATESPFSSPYSFSSVSLDLVESEKGRLTPPRKKPESVGRRSRQKSLSSSYTEDCGPDHPLSLKQDSERVLKDVTERELGRPHTQTPNHDSKSFLASNLSASIRVLKSAAKSFSGLSAARRQQLTRSILSISPQYTDEKRPVLYDQVPEPALRRYLNPCHVSPSEFHFHSIPDRAHQPAERCTISVQLQSYYRAPSPSKHATTPAIFPGRTRSSEEEASSHESSSTARPREPRENGDFLRIIVLEMNMRKAGKLSDTASGKARVWLPPRQVSAQASSTAMHTVPERWVGTVT